MRRALKEAVHALKAWVNASASRVAKIAKGEGTPGTRAAPTKTAVNNSQIGLPLDNGETVEKGGKLYKRFKLQANENASNPTVKEVAQRDTHRVFAEADMPIDDSISKEDKVSKVFEDSEEDIDRKLKK